MGLSIGCVVMTTAMLLWNYLIAPMYMGYSREEVFKLLLPVFLPFNVIKSVLNAIGTILLYKPVVSVQKRLHLI